jgi:hypothetical protein
MIGTDVDINVGRAAIETISYLPSGRLHVKNALHVEFGYQLSVRSRTDHGKTFIESVRFKNLVRTSQGTLYLFATKVICLMLLGKINTFLFREPYETYNIYCVAEIQSYDMLKQVVHIEPLGFVALNKNRMIKMGHAIRNMN